MLQHWALRPRCLGSREGGRCTWSPAAERCWRDPRCLGGRWSWAAAPQQSCALRHCAPEATGGGNTASRRIHWVETRRVSYKSWKKRGHLRWCFVLCTNLQATSTAQCARRWTLPTTRVASVRMLRWRSSFRFSSTSLAWRVNSFTYPSALVSCTLSPLYPPIIFIMLSRIYMQRRDICETIMKCTSVVN